MAFWSAPGPEPLRQYRWYITFAGDPELTNLKYALKKAEKPKAKVGTIQHKYMNHFFNYPGRLEWEDINITFAAVSHPSNASRVLFNVLEVAGYGVPQGTNNPTDMASIGKEKFGVALGRNFDIQQVDAQGTVVETWKLYNPFFTSVQFGALDYGSDEIVEITCGIKYDWAVISLGAPATDEKSFATPGLPK